MKGTVPGPRWHRLVGIGGCHARCWTICKPELPSLSNQREKLALLGSIKREQYPLGSVQLWPLPASLAGEVHYRSKYLQSDTYKANIEANRIVVSEFGTMAYPDPCKNIFSK